MSGPVSPVPVNGPVPLGPMSGPLSLGSMIGPVFLGPMSGPVSPGPMSGSVFPGPMIGPVSLGPMIGPVSPWPRSRPVSCPQTPPVWPERVVSGWAWPYHCLYPTWLIGAAPHHGNQPTFTHTCWSNHFSASVWPDCFSSSLPWIWRRTYPGIYVCILSFVTLPFGSEYLKIPLPAPGLCTWLPWRLKDNQTVCNHCGVFCWECGVRRPSVNSPCPDSVISCLLAAYYETWPAPGSRYHLALDHPSGPAILTCPVHPRLYTVALIAPHK